MGKLLTVDDLEIRFEKQHPSHASKWCIYIRAKLGEKTKSLMMIKTDNRPYATFSYDNGRTIAHSQKAKEEIMQVAKGGGFLIFVSYILLSSFMIDQIPSHKNKKKEKNDKK